MKVLEQEYGTELFNRLLFAWKRGEDVVVSHLSELQSLADRGEVTRATIVFNNAITAKKELDEKWMVPLEESWMHSRVRQHQKI